MGIDYYNVLKVSKDASDEDLKRSYRRLAMRWHPDKNSQNKKEAEAKFKQIFEAYDVLCDPKKRQIYDLFGEEGLKSGKFSGTSPTGMGEKGYRFSPSDSDDIFAEFLGGFDGKFDNGVGGRAAEAVKKAASVENKLPCTLEELYKGSKKKMKISRIVLDDSGKPKTLEEVLVINIKPGWKKGTKITFPEKGNYEPGAVPGDLIFVVDEKPHSTFKRDGNDLVIYQKISLLDALTGKALNLTSLDGRELIIPINDVVKPGQELKVPNEGMPISKEAGKKGYLRIKFDIKFPSRVTAEQKYELRRVLGRTAE